MTAYESIVRRLLFWLDPETAHRLSIRALRSGVPLAPVPPRDTRLAVPLCGIDFANPLGMAAGFDKDAEAPDGLLSLGFGFVEVGTVTPRPQIGNPRPRLFRLSRDEAVINRMGFNNHGHQACRARLVERGAAPGIIGVNIGANKDSGDRIADYEAGVQLFAPLASYLTLNISSPNTPGLRSMQGRKALGELLSRVVAAREGLEDAKARTTPLFVKIAPDLSEPELEDVAAEILERPIDGVVVSNTTIERPALSGKHAGEAGGLSGRPLFERSTAKLALLRQLLGPYPVIIGAGGVDSAVTALEKIRAGADLVQLYTGLIYGGPGLPGRILRDMLQILDAEGVVSVRKLRGTRLHHWVRRAYEFEPPRRRSAP